MSSAALAATHIEVAALRVLRPLGIAFFVLITLFPFYYMVLLSMREISEVIESPGQIFIPLERPLRRRLRARAQADERRRRGLRALPAQLGAARASATVIVTLAVSILGAYAVARLEFFGRRGRALPVPVGLPVPADPARDPAVRRVLEARACAASCRCWCIVYVAQTLPVCVYMLRNYFETVPVSLEEAAEVDGATRLQIIRKVTLPLAVPAIAATGLFVFMIAWNEFLFALLFLVEERDNWTVSLGVSQLTNIETPATTLMAGSVILTLPIIVLFLFAERLMTEGLTRGAEKG